MSDNVKSIYLRYLSQGVPPKEAAKLVQAQTGRSAVTGAPLKKKQQSVELYNTFNKGKSYGGQYGQ
jgi:hypothetical protein